ncbi:MAG: YfhO family protein, partial [Muribaculaceae bacterium]|nr:YfhO family protein [Muribaculaceae bacterium]
IFALFIIGCIVVKGPIKWMLLAVTLLSILLSWGHNFMSLTDFFIDCVPFYNKFRTVSSILVIAEFTMPLLAVLGLHKLFTAKNESKSKNELALYIGFGVSALICLMFVLMPGAGITDADNRVFTMATGGEMGQLVDHPELCKNIVDLRNSLVSADALYALMILIFGFGVLFTYMKWWRKVSPMVPSLILAGIILIDLVVVDKRYLNSEAFTPAEMVTEAKFEKTPADEQILKDTTMNYRVLDVAHFMEPRSSYYHKTVGGYHAAKLTRYNDLIEKQLTKNNMAVINMLNTKYFMIDENQIQPNPEALGNAWWVDSLEYVDNADAEMKFLDDFDPSKVAVADKKFKEALGAAETTEPGDTIFETTYAPNSLTYHSHSAKGGIAVFSEIYFPWGWTATVDGKEVPIGRVNYVLRALRLPAGDHTIVFKFDPQEVHKTVSVATIAVIVILLLAVAALAMPWFGQLFRRKKEN